ALLRAELARICEETDRARLADQSEMERVRGDAEREARARADAMLQAEIAEIRAQLDEVREAAREHARSAAVQAIFAEVARAEITIPEAAAEVAAPAGSNGRSWRVAFSIARQVMELLPARTLPIMAALLLVLGSLAFVDVRLLTQRSTSLARTALGTAGTVLGEA